MVIRGEPQHWHAEIACLNDGSLIHVGVRRDVLLFTHENLGAVVYVINGIGCMNS